MAQAPQGQPDALNEGRRIYLGLAIFIGRAFSPLNDS
jgi:hypothetical protein